MSGPIYGPFTPAEHAVYLSELVSLAMVLRQEREERARALKEARRQLALAGVEPKA